MLERPLLIVGDSLVQGRNATGLHGWAQMAAEAHRGVEIIGAGGLRLRGLRRRLQPEVLEGLQCLVIAVGINDSREQAPETFAAVLREILGLVPASVRRRAVVGLTSVDESSPFVRAKGFANADIARHDEVLRAEAARAGFDVVDVPDLAADPANLDDGIHPSDRGHALLHAAVSAWFERDS